MPGGNRKRDFKSMNEGESSSKHSPPLKRTKQKCAWCERDRERNDLCNRCRQKVESRAKKLLEQKIIGDHHVVKDTLEYIRENVAVSQLRGLDVLQCLEDLFPAKFLLSIFDKQYKGKKGNDVFSCPDRVLRIVVPEMIPTESSSDVSRFNREALKSLVQHRVDTVLHKWQNRDLGSFAMSLSGTSDSTPMNDPSLANYDETQPFMRKLALASWSTQNVASFLESCGVRPQVIMQSLRISNSLNITGRRFMELSDEELRVKWQLTNHSSAEILRHRCCYLWCCEKITVSNAKTMPNGIARFPIPMGFHGSCYDNLEKQLRLYGLRLIAVTSSYDPMSLVNEIPRSLRFGIDVIVAQGDFHVLAEMITQFCDSRVLPSVELVRHSLPNGVAYESAGHVMGTCVEGAGVATEFKGPVGDPMLKSEVTMDTGVPRQPQNTRRDGRAGGSPDSALSSSPLSSWSPYTDTEMVRSVGVPMSVDVGVGMLSPNGFHMPHAPNNIPPPIAGFNNEHMSMNGCVSRYDPAAMSMNGPSGKGSFIGGAATAVVSSPFDIGSGSSRVPQEFGDFYCDMNSTANAVGRNDLQQRQLYLPGNGWDERFGCDEMHLPIRGTRLMSSTPSSDSMFSSSSSVATDSLGGNEWQSLLC